MTDGDVMEEGKVDEELDWISDTDEVREEDKPLI